MAGRRRSAAWTVLAAASFAIGGCDGPDSDTQWLRDAGPSVAAEHASGVTGIDVSWLDESVRPQDDLWAYVNGKWLEATVIPADMTSWGGSTTLHHETQQRLRSLLDDLAVTENLQSGTDARKISDLYKSVLNTDLIETRGLAPVQDMLDEIGAVPGKEAWFRMTAELHRSGIMSPANLRIVQDPRNASRLIAGLSQSGTGLPSREYYIGGDEAFVAMRSAYKDYLESLLSLANVQDSNTTAENVFHFEHRLAEAYWTSADNRMVDKTNNILTAADLAALIPELNWIDWLDVAGVGTTVDIRVYQPSYFEALGRIVMETDLETLKAYSQSRVLSRFARYLAGPVRGLHFDFVYGVLYGITEEPAPWKAAIDIINAYMGDALGKIYVSQHFPPGAKARMDELVANVQRSFAISIENLDWMSEGTRGRALEKLARLDTIIGYSDKWKDYSTLQIDPDDLVGNLIRAHNFYHDRETAKLGRPFDRQESIAPPQIVNAFYRPARNQIFFPAAFLQPPNFFATGDDAVNYGAIGYVIGHEIGHAFDDQGRKYDGDGNIVDWWTDADAKAFQKKARRLVEQYNAYAPFEDLHINGSVTLGENIGDLTGLTIALRAYHFSLNGRRAPVIDGLTGDQRFFISFAQANRVKDREQELRSQILGDPHAPSEYRVRTVSNIPEFYSAFDVKPGDGMYRPPEARVSIWE